MNSMEQGMCPKCGTKKWVAAFVALVVGAVAGGYFAYTTGLKKGVEAEKARVETEKLEAEKKAAESVNPFGSESSNPFQNESANPFNEVKVNPFE